MNKLLPVIAMFLFFLTGYSQSANDDFTAIVNAERTAAQKRSNFRVNENTANYDVVYQKLDLAIDPAVYYISGSVTTSYIAKDNMNTLTFDLANQLTVSSVIQNGNSLAFTQNSSNELVILLPATQAMGTAGSVTVSYSGQPAATDGAFSIGSHNGVPVLWTLSEPYGAKDWWPCKQDLNDKIESIDVFITAPSQYISVSNGLQVAAVANSNGTRTTHFHHNYPIPAYLVAIAASNYNVFTQQAGTAPNTFPIVNYIYPETQEQTQALLAVTPPIMSLFERLFETYPFHLEKYGHAQCGIGGGMEHTTVSFMGSFGRELIAHELAHQWFGNKTTCASWNDIWLNEGFATYLSGLVIEHQDGNSNFNQWKASRIQDITSQPGGSVYVYPEDIEDISRIFSSRLSYNKAAMAVHMLRYKLGDETFYQGIKNYLADPALAFGYAKTADLQRHLEAASGTSLTGFFSDWIYGEGYPSYTIEVDNTVWGQVTLKINQEQSHPSVPYFEMPLTVRLSGTGGQFMDVLLDNTFNGQEFTIPVPYGITNAVFDPDYNIITANNTMVLNQQHLSLDDVVLYPNPASGYVTIKVPKGITISNATFYNTLGQKVMETANSTSWNVAALPAGVHFTTITTNLGDKQLKFVRE